MDFIGQIPQYLGAPATVWHVIMLGIFVLFVSKEIQNRLTAIAKAIERLSPSD